MKKNEESWMERRSNSAIKRPNDTRDPYVRDRARMIHSASFRRLQAKTQVLGVGESDFYRTRLTHSLEVAQIGSGIVKHLRKTGKADNQAWVEYLPTESLIETICLAHDIGHPPFGHGGEVALNFMMREYGGFEGNGQTLRILSQLDKYTESHGMDLTRRAMLGSVKYPEIYSKVFSEKHKCNSLREKDLNNPRKVRADDWKPPKCIFDEDEYILAWILKPLNVEEQKSFRKIEMSKEITKHNKPINKSFDTSIMDLSDDIAYGVHDLEDAIALKIITRESWDDEVVGKLKDFGINFGNGDINKISNDLFSKETYKRKSVIGGLVNWLVTSIHVVETEKFEHPFLKYKAKFSEQDQHALSILKDYVVKHVIKSTEVQLLEYKGQQMVIEIFEALSSDPERLLPDYAKYSWNKVEEVGDTKKSMRVICDYIAGMTDDYASKIHRALFVAGDGSIFNRL